MRGVPRSGLWSEADIASSGTGSERAKVASVAAEKPPREPEAPVAGRSREADAEGEPQESPRIRRALARKTLSRTAAGYPSASQSRKSRS